MYTYRIQTDSGYHYIKADWEGEAIIKFRATGNDEFIYQSVRINNC